MASQKSVRVIRASEINTYLFCQRAWWYQVRGFPSKNQAELASGKQLHEQHGKQAMVTGGLKIIAFFFLATSIVIMTVYLLFLWL
jgi:CRISPR/Cas system-associated exonuclease Cas4 (RecB family)